MTDKELRILDEMLTNLEIWSTWNKTFANEMIGICSKMRNLLADRKTEPQRDEFELFDREALILLIECQRDRIAELLAKTEPQTENE